MSEFNILVLAGDGIGPEVTAEGVRMLEAVGKKYGHTFHFSEDLVGGIAIDTYGTSLKPETLEAAKASDAVLWGAVGGPKWDDPRAADRPERGLLAFRQGLGLWANIRPTKVDDALINNSTIKAEVLKGTDVLIIRELTGGLYFGKPQERREVNGKRAAVDSMYYEEEEIARMAHLGFQLARSRKKKLTSVDKANVLVSSRLWREIVIEVSQEYQDVELEHVLVDAMTMHLIRRPSTFDVVIAENMFGDIITDEASMLSGSLGMSPSASLSSLRPDGTGLGMYEPIHGSAPDIAGKGIANPIGMLRCVSMLLRHSLGLQTEADAVEAAVVRAITDGCRTADIAIAGETVLSTREMAEAIIDRLE